MTIEALKDAKLSPMTAGYMAIYLKLLDLYTEAFQVSEMGYIPEQVDFINQSFNAALSKTQDEIMNLAVRSTMENLSSSDNTSLL